MKKQQLLVCVVNFIAFGSIFRIIFAEMGQKIFWELLIPCAIIFGTNMATILLCVGDKSKRKAKDDSLS